MTCSISRYNTIIQCYYTFIYINCQALRICSISIAVAYGYVVQSCDSFLYVKDTVSVRTIYRVVRNDSSVHSEHRTVIHSNGTAVGTESGSIFYEIYVVKNYVCVILNMNTACAVTAETTCNSTFIDNHVGTFTDVHSLTVDNVLTSISIDRVIVHIEGYFCIFGNGDSIRHACIGIPVSIKINYYTVIGVCLCNIHCGIPAFLSTLIVFGERNLAVLEESAYAKRSILLGNGRIHDLHIAVHSRIAKIAIVASND